MLKHVGSWLLAVLVLVVPSIAALPACSSDDGPGTTPSPETTSRFDPDASFAAENEFFAFPYPSDLRLTAEGTPDVASFPDQDIPLLKGLKLADDVTEEAKSERLTRLFEVAEAQTRAHLETLVGTRQKVLVEGASKAEGKLTGRTERNEIVHVPASADHDLVGSIVDVTIARAFKHSLEGALTDESLASLPPRRAGARDVSPRRRRMLPLLGT